MNSQASLFAYGMMFGMSAMYMCMTSVCHMNIKEDSRTEIIDV